MVAAVLVLLALCATAVIISYVMSGKVPARGRGIVEHIGRFVPLQSVKNTIVTWQILTQVRATGTCFPDLRGSGRSAQSTGELDSG